MFGEPVDFLLRVGDGDTQLRGLGLQFRVAGEKLCAFRGQLFGFALELSAAIGEFADLRFQALPAGLDGAAALFQTRQLCAERGMLFGGPGRFGLECRQLLAFGFESLFFFGARLLDLFETCPVALEVLFERGALFVNAIELRLGVCELRLDALGLFGQFAALMIERQNFFFLGLLTGA